MSTVTDTEIGGNSILAFFFRHVECIGGDSTPGPIIRGKIICGGTLCYNTGNPPLTPKTQFIIIKFINQRLNLLNISNIFRDHRVTSKIPKYFENLDPPLICYQYKSY